MCTYTFNLNEDNESFAYTGEYETRKLYITDARTYYQTKPITQNYTLILSKKSFNS